MSSSFTSVFSQIRLNSDITSTSGHARMVVANNAHMLISDSGAFTSSIALTGQNLYNLITSLSGLDDAYFVHKTGVELITGIKTFVSEFRFNSGLKTPVQYFGDANYTLTSGNYVLIATGATNWTGILPPPTDYSGVLFTIINNKTISLPLSGVINGATNPNLQPLDSLQLYATSGNWFAIRQTGSPIWADQDNNARNISGNLTQTGITLYNTLAGLSGVINSNNYIQYINATGLYVNVATGSDTQYVPFGLTFSTIPKINLTLDINAEITSSSYGVVTSGRSTTGVYIIYSDSVSALDTGLGVSMWIHI